jgi:hypothetical protein
MFRTEAWADPIEQLPVPKLLKTELLQTTSTTPILRPAARGLHAEYYPMGFPVEIETNSPDVLAAAASAWGPYPRLSDGAQVKLRVGVAPGPPKVFRAIDAPSIEFDTERICVDGGPGNHAVASLAEGWGEIAFTADRAANFDYVRYHFLEPLVYLLLAPPHYAFAHAACVALNGHAIVLIGEAAAGKTCLAYACARRGWTFLSGDATHFLHGPDELTVAGRPFSIRFRESARDLFPELKACPATIRPNQRFSIEADTKALNIETALRARAGHLVFLARRPPKSCSAAHVENMVTDETVRQLDETALFGNCSIRRNQRETLRRFAALPAVRLVYSDFDSAESVLRELIGDGP